MNFKSINAILCAGSLLVGEALAQQTMRNELVIPETKPSDALIAPRFPQKEFFRRMYITPPTKMELRPPARLRDFVIDGKLELSLKNYVDLVMANNTDIEIQRATVELQQNAITRAYSIFDPLFTANFTTQRTKSPSSSALDGTATLNQLSQPATFAYNQLLQSGTQINVGFGASKLSTNSSFSTFNPSINSNFSFGFSQPLLRNRGGLITKLPITIAKSRLRASQWGLEDSLITLLTTSENAYWNLVGGRETLRVREKALELNAEALKRSRRELELGAISPLDIYLPEANYASAEIAVSQARFSLQQLEDIFRRQLGVDLDPEVRKLPVNLTESVLPPANAAEIDREGSVARAISIRQDLKAAQQNLSIDDLSIKSAVNGLRPDFALTGNYSSTGRGGTYYQRSNVFGGGQVVDIIPGGFGDSLDQVFGFGFPIYQVGLRLRLPLRDRAAAANFADALVNKKLDTLRVRTVEQQVRLDVLTAASQVESSKASVRLAIVNRDLAQKQLDAEQKKYDLGTTVIFFVLDAQQRLVNAEADLVNQSVGYRRNLLTFLNATGELLTERGVTVR
jgi:outer membrane protein